MDRSRSYRNCRVSHHIFQRVPPPSPIEINALSSSITYVKNIPSEINGLCTQPNQSMAQCTTIRCLLVSPLPVFPCLPGFPPTIGISNLKYAQQTTKIDSAQLMHVQCAESAMV
ncbi:hypothetical protein DsansV1_C30g0213951 [Dioscorea sansibarensis]